MIGSHAVGVKRISLAGVALLSVGCSSPPTPAPEPTRPVKTMVVVAGEEAHLRTFPGKTEAAKNVELAFQVSGLLVKLPVREGQKVAKGELIAQLRQDEFATRLKTVEAQLDQARAALRSLLAGERPEEQRRRETAVRAAEARLANAKLDLDRATRLFQSNTIPRAEFDRNETSYRVASEDLQAAREVLEKGTIGREEDIDARQAEVRSLEARVVEAQLQLADSTLEAPYDGVIARRFVEEQQNIRAKESVVRFQDAQEIEILVDVPEAVMAREIRTADILQLVAELSAAPGREFPVYIKEVAQQSDPATQTFQVRVAMPAPTDLNVLPGMTATVTVSYRRANILDHRILVPVSAVMQESAGSQVAWVIGADQTVTRRPVKLGQAEGSEVEIMEGLQPGDRIAVAGVNFLREGMKVRDLGDALGSR